MPINDLKDHEESKDCWCSPEIDQYIGGDIVIHNSMDGREDYEAGARKPS